MEEGVLWYSCKSRKDASFFEKYFDSSYDGIFAAAAGAAIGAMGVRRMTLKHGVSEEESRAHENQVKNRWKTAAGAVAGAAAFNAGENWFRVYTEAKAEHPAAQGMELAMECVDNLV